MHKNKLHQLLIQCLTPFKIRRFINSIKPAKTNFDLLRIGCNNDGGYLIPNDLDNIVACFSPGVSDNASFERELAERGIKCYLADYSVERPPCEHPKISFLKKYLGTKSADQFISLEDWIHSTGKTVGDLLLQMDIEGAEYDILNDLDVVTLQRFRIIVIELHGLGRLGSIKKGLFDHKLCKCAEKLSRYFDVVHLHPNNISSITKVGNYEIPDHLEITLIRKDRVTSRKIATNFPHKLDMPNLENLPDLVLPPCWYK